MSSTPSTLSASVTRILSLTGFPKELKTKDIQTAFSEWETLNGGFKIKWIDDTSLYIVFQDPTVAKRAYLRSIAFPPATFTSASSGVTATIKPYDGPDAQQVIQAINSRQNNTNGARRSASISVPNTRGGRPGHSSSFSMAVSGGVPLATPAFNAGGIPERSSPTLPDLPSHPTLESLMGQSFGNGGGMPPRIGDPGKRMVAHGLGVRHPNLGQKAAPGVTSPPQEALSRAIGGLTISE